MLTMLEKMAVWFLIFMTYSFLGWLMEVIIGVLQRHKLVNRGFLVGPICPIYGTGALLISWLLSSTDNVFAIFCVGLVGGAILEYSVSFLMEKFFRVRWWDYSKKPFNLNGRICLESITGFGLLGVFIVKFTTPFFYHLFSNIYQPLMLALAAGLLAWLIADIALSLWLVLNVRVTVGTVERDATEEISTRVKEILMEQGKLKRRLVKAFPNQEPSKKPAKKPKSKSV